MNRHDQALNILDRARILATENMAWFQDKDIADTEVILVAQGLILTRIFTAKRNAKYAKEEFSSWIKTIEHMVYNELRKAKDEGTGG